MAHPNNPTPVTLKPNLLAEFGDCFTPVVQCLHGGLLFRQVHKDLSVNPLEYALCVHLESWGQTNNSLPQNMCVYAYLWPQTLQNSRF